MNYNYRRIASMGVALVLGIAIGKIPTGSIPGRVNYVDYIQASEVNAWNSLAHSYDLTREECEQRKQELRKNLTKSSNVDKKFVSLDNCTLIRSVLKDFDVDPKTIIITACNDNTSARTDHNIIFVNEKIFNELSPKAKKFVIGHELQHMKNQDFLMREVLNERIKDRPIDGKSVDEAINVYARFKEERADIQAALKNKEYAQGYVEYAQQKLLVGDNPGITHPKNSKRIQMAEDIFHQWKNNILIQSC